MISPAPAAIQVAHIPVRAMQMPNRVKNKEFKVKGMRFWDVRILETKIGKSKASMLLVEKEDPVGVKLAPCVQAKGNILIPK